MSYFRSNMLSFHGKSAAFVNTDIQYLIKYQGVSWHEGVDILQTLCRYTACCISTDSKRAKHGSSLYNTNTYALFLF